MKPIRISIIVLAVALAIAGIILTYDGDILALFAFGLAWILLLDRGRS